MASTIGSPLYFGPDGWIAMANGSKALDGLSAWRNGDSNLCNSGAVGIIRGFDNQHLTFDGQNNIMGEQRFPNPGGGYAQEAMVETVWKPAEWSMEMDVQSGIPWWWVDGVCETSATNKHTISKRTYNNFNTDQTTGPMWLAFYVQNGSTAKQIYQLLGTVVDDVTFTADRTTGDICRWAVSGRSSYCKNLAHASALTKPTDYPNIRPFTGADLSVKWQYNSKDIAVDVLKMTWHTWNETQLLAYQPAAAAGLGYATQAVGTVQRHEIKLTVHPRDYTTGTDVNLHDLNRLRAKDYAAAGMTLTTCVARNGTYGTITTPPTHDDSTDYICRYLNSAYMLHFNENLEFEDFIEYEVTLIPFPSIAGATCSTVGTVSTIADDALTESFYENET